MESAFYVSLCCILPQTPTPMPQFEIQRASDAEPNVIRARNREQAILAWYEVSDVNVIVFQTEDCLTGWASFSVGGETGRIRTYQRMKFRRD